MIGGYILSFVFLSLFLSSNYISEEINELSIDLYVFIFFVSTVSQVGDIIISYFKRLSKIKDTGKIIPGHGGLLDRIDGMIFALPFSYLILKLNIFNFI
jgi:CDP-diglyceride synthetase